MRQSWRCVVLEDLWRQAAGDNARDAAAGQLPRVGRSTKGEGTERRYFYGTVWAVTIAQTILLILWKTIPRGAAGDWTKLAVYVVALALMGFAAYQGKLPRTRPIVAGELMVD